MTLRRPSRSRSVRSAFTLLEMLIVIALIGLLATVAVVNFAGVDEGARQDMAGVWVKSSATAPLWAYKRDIGRFPSTEEGLRALLQAPDSASGRWRGPYLQGKDIPEDPWRKPYQYRYPGSRNTGSYDLYSFGPDGVESADDIGNWN